MAQTPYRIATIPGSLRPGNLTGRGAGLSLRLAFLLTQPLPVTVLRLRFWSAPPAGMTARAILRGSTNGYRPSAFSIACTSSGDSGATDGSNRPMTRPSPSTRNFVKFHFTSPPVSGWACRSVRYRYSGA